MLIEGTYKEGDIVTFKLTNGEEIVARLDKQQPSDFVINKPMVLIASQQGMGLAPFMFSVAPTSKFYLQHTGIICIAKTEAEIAKQYTTQTSGIALN
jgi:hypothetical protein